MNGPMQLYYGNCRRPVRLPVTMLRATPGQRTTAPWNKFMILFSVAALLQGVRSQITALQTYPVNWEVVPASPPTTRNVTASCNCDLLNIGCTLGCCCSSNCPSSLTSLFESEGTCLPSGAEQQTLKFCVPNGFVSKVNLPSNGDFYVQPVEQANAGNFFSQLLCIQSDRNPNIGETYPDPATGAKIENVRLAQCPAASSSSSSSQQYYPFQSYVYVQRSGRRVPLTVPYPAFSAACNDQFAVGFMVPTPVSGKTYYAGCQRDLAALNLTTACSGSGLLSPQYYTGLSWYPDLTSTAATSFTVLSVQYLNQTTGALTSISKSSTASYVSASNLCRNALRYMNITFYYSLDGQDGYITSAEMTLVLTDVTGSSTPFPQSVRVSWIDNEQSGSVEFAESGNPGYITGFPLLAGSLVTDSATELSAVSRFVGGLPVGAPGVGGECGPTSLAFVNFGANTSSSCSVALTATQLSDFCINEATNPAKYLASALGSFYPAITGNNLYLGIWGNSQFNNTNDWVQVSMAGSPSNYTTYSRTDSACLGVITGFSLQIVTGVAFASNNLQQKVLYANLCLKSGTWDFSEDSSTNATQRFYLNFDVSFIPLPQQATKVKKPAPPLVAYLPADIFYPFVVSDSGVTACRISAWFAVFSAALVLVAVQYLRRL